MSVPAEGAAGRPAGGVAKLGLVGLLAALAGFVVVGQLAGGELSQLALAGTTIFPFILLAGLLQVARLRRAVGLLAWAWFWLLLSGFGLMALGLTSSALAAGPASGPAEAIGLGLVALLLLALAGLTASGTWLAVGCWLGGRLRADDPAHAQAVVGMLGAIAISAVPLLVLGGQPPLLLELEGGDAPLGLDRSTTGQVLDFYYQLAWMLPLALIGAGVPLTRAPRAGLERLGLRPLGWRALPLAAALAAGLWLLSSGVDLATAGVWEAFGWPRTDPESVNRLMGAALSPAGAVAAALSAGIGEEVLVRGLLQPRVGWLLANLAFTAVHAFQYGADALLAVFVLGGALALVRARWNTSLAILVHGLYDLALFLAAGWPLGS